MLHWTKLGKTLLRKSGYKALVTEKPSNVNCKKNTFGETVDSTKSMINSCILSTSNNVQVSNLMILTNKPQMKINCNNTSLINRHYCTNSCEPVGRHRYHEETESAINNQILAEFNACYAYLSMACFFGRTDVALPGCQGFFIKMHHEEHEHALTFIDYQIMRGGHVTLCPLTVPPCQNWEDIRKALAVAVEMEKLIKEKLQGVYCIAEKHQDLHVMDLISAKFMAEQERSICEIARLLTRATQMGNSGIADYLFDKEMHRAFVKNAPKETTEDKENKSNKLYI